MAVTSEAQTPVAAPSKPGARVASIDALKGLIMIVMALDHVRSFFMRWDGVKEFWYQPATYNPDFWDFMARYVSHLAAPGFSFSWEWCSLPPLSAGLVEMRAKLSKTL